jgi:hypothetical protein
MRVPSLRPSLLATIAGLGFLPVLTGACGNSHGSTASQGRVSGQSDYEGAPLPGSAQASSFSNGNATAGASGSSSGGTKSAAPQTPVTTTQRQIQETDLYRVSGNTLYYLNSYRGLMVFDITNVDQPKLVGRSAIFGDPQDMIISGNVAVVIVGDWYGTDKNGYPFYGSIARGLDCTDPTNIQNVGDAYLGGYVQDTRVVGSVLYTVAQDDGWQYGWYYGGWGGYGYYGGGGVGLATPGAAGVSNGTVSSNGVGGYGTGNTSQVVIASVNFANGTVQKVGEQKFAGTGGIFNVTTSSIMLATQTPVDPNNPNAVPQTFLQYVDISDPNGAIALRGSLSVPGWMSGWGPDNGRWNLDFTDGAHAHTLGCASQYCGGATDTYVLTNIDFTNPDAPTVASTMPIANLGWSAAARFDVDQGGAYAHMYLSPSDTYYQSPNGQTPLSIYDISNEAAPKLAGQTGLDGNIWLFVPQGNQLFALGNTYSSGTYDQSLVDVQYVDVTNPAAPTVLGSTQFGSGWAWSPAADTFKAFVVNSPQGLAVVPFSGWDDNSGQYFNGVQLVQFTSTGLTGSATARTKGWVERGIFVKNRLLSLSDESMAVVDYTNPAAPSVVSEMALARNVVSASPQGATIAELSSDWWGNDVTTSEMRVLPIADAQETTDDGTTVSTTINGVDAQTFQNGTLSYVVTDIQVPVPCSGPYGYGSPNGPGGQCTGETQQVTVVDTSNGNNVIRGTVQLPMLPYWVYGGWGWGGFWYYDWYDGADVVQVGTDALAFRRWYPQYSYDPNTGYPVYQDDLDALYVVDLSNADAPTLASLTITNDATAWWGNMQAIGNTLYTTDYEWVTRPDPNAPGGQISWTRYYLDQIDLSDRSHPRVGQRINVPGTLVGASSEDASILYFADYNWNGQNENDSIAVCQVSGSKCYLQSDTLLDGYVGNVIVQNDKAYMTVQQYDWAAPSGQQPYIELHQLDLSTPQSPVDRISTDPDNGWGWLLSVNGDRAVVTSGWGPMGVDIYQLSDTAAPAYEESVRTLGWGTNAITRQGSSLFLSSGYWGVQQINLQ